MRARNLVKDWADDGLLTAAQCQRMEKESVSDLRTTNVFLRLVLFLFTLVILVAALGLFFVVFQPSEQSAGVFLLIFAAVSYAAAEFAVSEARLYRYGIEEAFTVCSVSCLCLGMQFALFSASSYAPKPHGIEFLVPAAGAVFSLWIWHRFGLWYAFVAAMIFVMFLPGYWTSSHSAQHLLVAAFYATGLTGVAAVRSRHSFVEALLWLGIYVAINLQLSSLKTPGQWWGGAPAAAEFARPFYWATWVLIWCLPPIVLVRGIRRKDRFVIAVGGITAILTLVTNKPYLGWPRHTWDPLLLGALLIGVALLVRRWLSRGPAGVRHGFTAERLSAKHKTWMNAGVTAVGMLSPQSIPAAAPAPSHDPHFSGGDFGGGGASGDFRSSTGRSRHMISERSSQQAFLGVSALLFAASAAVTIVWCASMSATGGMPMPGGWTMSMTWMPMPGQTWPGAAGSFLAMWDVMMVAMMLPSLAPMLWRYRQAVGGKGEARLGRLTALVGAGYFFVWTVVGIAAWPLGVALAAAEIRLPELARAVPAAAGVVVLIAGALQFTPWKAHHLACCRDTLGSSRTLRADAGTAWRHGVRLGLHCSSAVPV